MNPAALSSVRFSDLSEQFELGAPVAGAVDAVPASVAAARLRGAFARRAGPDLGVLLSDAALGRPRCHSVGDALEQVTQEVLAGRLQLRRVPVSPEQWTF